jgi:multidrug efflux pump subunit AcrB
MSTIAVVIVFIPMSFITGMMGPYMSPMAFNVPVAVITSTAVAFLITPWLGLRLLRPTAQNSEEDGGAVSEPRQGLYARLAEPLLTHRRRGIGFLVVLGVLFVVSALMPFLRVVPLKLLPYDNKNEFQLVIDMPEGATLEATDALAGELAAYLAGVDEVRAINAFVGTHAPMDFNGMIRRYYHRDRTNEGELHVVLADRLARADQSHALILRLRPDVEAIAARHGGKAKLVEVPPGPPVIASIVAEVYGSPTTPYDVLVQAARRTATRLEAEPGVVDVDVSAESESRRWVLLPDQEKASLSGIGPDTMRSALDLLAGGTVAGYGRVPDEAAPLPIRLQVPYPDRGAFGQLFIKGQPGITKIRDRGSVTDAATPLVAMAELVERVELPAEQPIYHKDLRPVAYAFAEVAGRVPAAVVYDVDADLGAEEGAGDEEPKPLAGRTYFTSGGGLPWALPEDVTVRWSGEGEWNITIRVFRDLGIAFGVALVGLFAVIRLQTGLTSLTFIIMLAIPLTVIGIMPGFWLLNALTAGEISGYADPVLFTATAMIGMIALAGIVVRNSLILIEFVGQARERGMDLRTSLLEAGRLRARPVLLTAGTTLLGNLVITLDPIFSGLAWAIIFGVLASTVFTLFVVPVVYALVYTDTGKEPDTGNQGETHELA